VHLLLMVESNAVGRNEGDRGKSLGRAPGGEGQGKKGMKLHGNCGVDRVWIIADGAYDASCRQPPSTISRVNDISLSGAIKPLVADRTSALIALEVASAYH